MTEGSVRGFRLSPQQRTVLRWEAGADEAPFRTRGRVRWRGPLDPERWRVALRRLVERHEVLRTSFERAPGMAFPVQVVGAPGAPVCRVHDLSAVPGPEERERAVEDLAAATGVVAGNGAGPLAVDLVRLGEDDHLALLSLPAACADATSVAVLARELAGLYAGPGDGALPLPDVTVQYADVSEVFNQLLESEDAAAGVRFWRGVEIQPAAAQRLSFRLDAPPEAPFAPATVRHRWPCPELVAGAAEARWLLATCWLILLRRLAGGGPVCLGLACAGRDYEGLEAAVGPFARQVPLAVELEPDLPFADAVARVRSRGEELEEWQESFDWERLKAGEGDDPGPGFFPFGFELQDGPTRFGAGGLVCEVERRSARIDRFELRGVCRPAGEDLEVDLEVDLNRYGVAAAEQVLDSFAGLLESALGDPARRLRDLDAVGPRQRRWLDREWNGDRAAGEPPLAHEGFEGRAARDPERPAVVFDGGHWTYGELEARAARIARCLIGLGVGPEEPVGVCLERTPELVATLLGVLRAGAAFLILDPGGPPERTRLMVRMAGARFVVADEGAAGGDRRLTPAGLEERGARSSGPDRRDVHSGQLAYVLFTSGSTGEPKGVMVSHRSLGNYLRWTDRTLLRGGVTELPLTSRPAFDAALKQLFTPLWRGGAVRVLPPEAREHPGRLLEAASTEGSALNCVTSMWRAVLDAAEAGRAAAPETGPTVYVGGERFDEELLARSFAAFPGLELWNLYGPTEVTANATAGRLRSGRPVRLGRPLTGAEVHLVDDRLRRLPPGMAGRIAVGGTGLARGYRGRPALTAERFLPDPFSDRRGGRLYDTGDLGRLDAGGELEFLGRRDDQVKVRGVRVELGEVEQALRRQPGVADCAVELEERDGAVSLAAYVEAGGGDEVETEELRRRLVERLPEAMVPARWVVLAQLPRTPGGKVDKRALHGLEPVSRGVSAGFEPPRPGVEEMLAGMWRELLGAERVGREDGFYDLGGHSLLAVQLLARIARAFEVELPLRTLLGAEHLAGMARRIEEARQAEVGAPGAPPLVPAGADGDRPLSFNQERLFFLHRFDPESPTYHVPAALRLRGALRPGVLEQALTDVFRRHEVLRSRFRIADGEPVCRVAPPEPLAIPVVDLRGLPAEGRRAEVEGLALRHAERPFDLGAEPLVRPRLLRAGGEESAFLLPCHHIVFDGWSGRVLLDELGTLYDAFRAGRPSPLEELPIQYSDYAAWQREWLRGPALEERLGFWRRRLSGIEPIRLPTDRPRPAVLSARGAVRRFEVDGERVEGLRAEARREGGTLFMLLLAAFEATLHSVSGSTDLAIATHMANRHRPETERVIGMFVNQLVLRTDLGENPTLRELHERVRRVALEAFDHQDLPLNVLLRAARPARDLGQNPLFQVLFHFQNLPEVTADLAGLAAEPLRVDTETAPFDLSLHMKERGAGLEGFWRYSTDLFEARTIEAIDERFGLTLRWMSERPEARLDRLVEELGAAERERRRREALELERAAGRKLAATRGNRRKLGRPAAGGPRTEGEGDPSREDLSEMTAAYGAVEDRIEHER